MQYRSPYSAVVTGAFDLRTEQIPPTKLKLASDQQNDQGYTPRLATSVAISNKQWLRISRLGFGSPIVKELRSCASSFQSGEWCCCNEIRGFQIYESAASLTIARSVSMPCVAASNRLLVEKRALIKLPLRSATDFGMQCDQKLTISDSCLRGYLLSVLATWKQYPKCSEVYKVNTEILYECEEGSERKKERPQQFDMAKQFGRLALANLNWNRSLAALM